MSCTTPSIGACRRPSTSVRERASGSRRTTPIAAPSPMRPLSTPRRKTRSTRLGGVNPVTGPIAVDGARAGDCLVISIEEIVPAPRRHAGYTCSTSRVHPDLVPETVICHIEGEDVLLPTVRGPVRLPMRPMIGTLGVAPRASRARRSVRASTSSATSTCRPSRPGRPWCCSPASNTGCSSSATRT